MSKTRIASVIAAAATVLALAVPGVAAAAAGPPSIAAPAAAAPSSLNVLAVLVDWTAPIDGVTQTSAAAELNGPLKDWFAATSYGAMSVRGAATNWLTIPAPADPDGSGDLTPCQNRAAIQASADPLAKAAGYDPAGYTNIVYLYPKCAGSGTGGTATLGGNRAWFTGSWGGLNTGRLAHELGHNLGLNHADTSACTYGGAAVAYSTTCTVTEYGDVHSAMGGYPLSGAVPGYGAGQLAALGWLGTGSHTVQTVTGPGTYTIAPIESAAGGTQALRMRDDQGTDLWVEFRRPTGNDAALPSGITNGVVVRSLDANNYTYLYDMTPSTVSVFHPDDALAPGATWTDPQSALTLKVNSVSDAGANVTVTMTQSRRTLTVTKSGTATGTVTSLPAGISCGATCTGTFASGTSITLTATPDAGKAFTGWTGACTGMSATCTLKLTADATAEAKFDPTPPVKYTVNIDRATYSTAVGTVTSSPAGISCGATCTGTFAAGTVLTLTATPDADAEFTFWNGPCVSVAPTCTFTVNANAGVVASFNPKLYDLTVVTPVGGSIVSSPEGIGCGTGGSCNNWFLSSSRVALTATPSVGYSFTGWSGACQGSDPTCEVLMTGDLTATATFTRSVTTYALTVAKAGTGSGTVTSSPTGISCGATCSASYASGTQVSLTAAPASGSTFTGWSGACTGTGACTVGVDAAKSVTATFTVIPPTTYALTVAKAGTGSGTVTSSPAGISCGATCTASYASGTQVSLTAAPASGSTFTGWSGACTGTGACTVGVDAAKSVTATFTVIPPTTYALTVAKAGTGSGTVTSSPAGISCGATCTASYASGTQVSLTAAPASGSTFTGWSGACTGTGACTVGVDAAKSVTATFVAAGDVVVTGVSWTPTGVAPGAAVKFSATLKNQGAVATPSAVKHVVAFLVDGVQVAISDTRTTSVAAAASVTVAANTTWPATAGRHAVTAVFDPAGLIRETNKANNTSAAKTLDVYTARAASSVLVSAGKVKSGTVAALTAKDSVFYVVSSTTSGSTRTGTFDATFEGVPDATAGVQITFAGKSSVASTSQAIQLWNWTTNAWVSVKTRTVGTTTASVTVVPTMADYVSSTGQVKVRVKSTKASTSFYVSNDQLTIGYL